MLDLSSRSESPCKYSAATQSDFSEASNPSTLNTITGKPSYYCPSLYFSLTTWERDLLDNSPSSSTFTSSTPSHDHPLPFLENPSTSPSSLSPLNARPSTQPPPLLPPTTSPYAPPRTPRATYAQVIVAARNTSSAPDTLPPLVESSLDQFEETSRPLVDFTVGHIES
jgi:hypothetical protein